MTRRDTLNYKLFNRFERSSSSELLLHRLQHMERKMRKLAAAALAIALGAGWLVANVPEAKADGGQIPSGASWRTTWRGAYRQCSC